MSETVHLFTSACLGNERTVWIRRPKLPSAPCNLAIFLDGELYREKVEALSVIGSLEASTSIANTLFVFVSVSTWEARWKECPCNPLFAQFINEELLPWLIKQHPLITAAPERALIGLSYTGLAAAYAALQYPASFTRVIAQSGSFWSNDCWLVEQFRLRGTPLPTAFYLDVGSHETEENVQHKEDVLQVVSQIDAIRRLRSVLLEQGYRIKYQEFDGGHDCLAWKKTLPAALCWALPTSV
ncbi:MAG: hypothetical protein KA257_02000 [Opitutaceae bacterium]|nr:hypothetical protein [Opitutaceae bacterium]MBP9912239.1 hypothetical protein [Opitutaceae bacterium]